jgi:PleD family two-component response regulator
MAILPHTTRAGAEITAKRMLGAARALGFEAEGRALQITLSIGISNYESENTLFFDSLVDAAETGLVQAVDEGGDRTIYRAPGPGGAR